MSSQRRPAIYDKGQDGHYNLISALHKSVRGSDPDAALYYLARMLDAGENPLYLGRRLVRMAVEDIGLADPRPWSSPMLPRTPMIFSARPKGNWLSPRRSSISPPPQIQCRLQCLQGGQPGGPPYGSLLPPKHILNAPPS